MSALRGVNLGGWLVLEKWMTPTLFEGSGAVDEYTFMQSPGARAKLREHQRAFMREEDFKWLADNNINALRIPVGYWIIDGDTPYVSCIGHLDWAFRMAEKYNLHVLLCLHGAPGSQNGHDHSGRVGKALWYIDGQYRMRTLQVLQQLAQRYRDSAAFWGLELLNEPKPGIVQYKLRRFYNDAYRQLQPILRPTTHIVFHDAFTPRMLNGAIWSNNTYPVVMDIHWYHFAFWAQRIMPLTLYYRVIIGLRRHLIARLQRWQGVVIGEWNGIISGIVLNKSPVTQHDAIIREHIAVQLRAYRQADAWFYWSYKTEHRGVWHFRSLVEDGVVRLD